LLLPALPAQALQHHLLIITGIGGIDSYRQQFARASTSLAQAALEAGIEPHNIIVLAAEPAPDSGASQRLADKATISQALLEISRKAGADDRIFVVLIGHGNARGDSAVFNLPGPDISATELAAALAVLEDRLTIVINTASASGPFITALSRDNRVVITATSSAREYQATVFGDYLVAAFATGGADRDKDERISMLEAFDYARREVKRSFSGEKRLLTEHALLDDNGDGTGSLDPGEFQGDGALANRIYLQQPPSLAGGASSELLAMLQSKQVLEQSISALKRQRASIPPENYYADLERLLVELALLTRKIRAGGG
jgi:hypothetical protein